MATHNKINKRKFSADSYKLSSITYGLVAKRHQENLGDLKTWLLRLEEEIISGRDNQQLRIPVYLTKSRIKSINSIFLKIKRKSCKSLDEITDYAGLRILCLFEQDVFDVHEFLISKLADGKYELSEFKIYNWDNKHDAGILKDIVDSKFENYEYDPSPKSSGYKSLHYIVKRHNHVFEVQLRTLLQDVWGELDHALSYKKGNVHQHIEKSFQLLARDIQTNDLLLSHLRSVKDRELCVEAFAIENVGPYKVLGYEETFIPDIFKQEGEKKDAWDKYWKYITTTKKGNNLKVWVENGSKLLDVLISKLSAKEAEDEKTNYIRQMEAAFLFFTGGELEKALDIYNSFRKKSYYLPYFRFGEILFIKGDIVNALIAFDRCEEIMESYKIRDYANEYRVKIKLANIYWLLGKEYIPIALNEICDAEKIFLSHKDLFDKRDETNLLNNLCWYYLERYIQTEKPQDFEEVIRRYTEMEKVLENEDAGREYYDTAMWFFYHWHLKEHKSGNLENSMKYLEKSRELCRKGRDLEMYATNKITISNVIRNHIQAIMGEISWSIDKF